MAAAQRTRRTAKRIDPSEFRDTAEGRAYEERLKATANRNFMTTRRTEVLLAAAGDAAPEAGWYVLDLHSGCDKAVENGLNERGIECWLAEKVVMPRRRGKRCKAVREPRREIAFPGYLFIRVSWWPGVLGAVKTVKGIAGVLGRDGEPAAVKPSTVAELRRFLGDDPEAAVAGERGMGKGDAVEIRSGPFQWLRGLIASDPDGGWARVELMLFGRSTVTSIDLAQLEKIA